MTKLNAAPEAATPYLWQSLGIIVVAVMVAGVSSKLSAFAFLIALYQLVRAIWAGIAQASHKEGTALALRTLPDVSPAIGPSGAFTGHIPQVDRPAPVMSKNITKFIANQEAIAAHLAYLESIQTKTSAIMQRAVSKYRTDRGALEDQQIILYRMAHQAAGFAARVAQGYPAIRADLQAVPQPVLPSLPSPPAMLASATYAKRTDQARRGTAHSIGRMGLEAAKGNVGAAIVGVFVVGTLNVLQFNKHLRAMHESHGRISNFAAKAKGDFAALGLAHRELVTISTEVHRQSSELHALVSWADAQAKSGAFAANQPLDESARQKVTALQTFGLISRLHAARAV
jgi:hypothetical protein